MATYKSSYTGPQIDQAVGNALNKDTSTLSNDVNHIPASSVVKSAITHDLANIGVTGTTNTTGATIASGTYFYLNGTLVRAKANIAVNATFTSGTNYEAVTAGGLNDLKAAISGYGDSLVDLGLNANGYIARTGNIVCMYIYNPTSAMTQNADYVIGNLPQKYIPYDGMEANGYSANGRDYYVTIASGNVRIKTPNALPATGIPTMQVYLSWIAKY